MSEEEHKNGAWNPLEQLIETDALQQETLGRHEKDLALVHHRQEVLKQATSTLHGSIVKHKDAIVRNQEALRALMDERTSEKAREPSVTDLNEELNLVDQLKEMFDKGLEQSSEGLTLLREAKTELESQRDHRVEQRANVEEVQNALDEHLKWMLLLVPSMVLMSVMGTMAFMGWMLPPPSGANPSDTSKNARPISQPSPQHILHASSERMSKHEHKVARALIAKSQGLPLNATQRNLLKNVNRFDPDRNRRKRGRQNKRGKRRE